jgi:hypothetical protein
VPPGEAQVGAWLWVTQLPGGVQQCWTMHDDIMCARDAALSVLLDWAASGVPTMRKASRISQPCAHMWAVCAGVPECSRTLVFKCFVNRVFYPPSAWLCPG